MALSRLRRFTLVAVAALALPFGVAAAAPDQGPAGTGRSVGSPGLGDPYYPNSGNGGYDVRHYRIDVAYTPATDRLVGTTTLKARAKQRLERFNLDLVLRASEVRVDGHRARFAQSSHEVVVRPRHAVEKGQVMTVEVTYAGVPSNVVDAGISPWIRTDDGAAAVGEPQIAAWWYAGNDHPRDKARFDVRVTVPRSLEALGNGHLISRSATAHRRTWHWREAKPMATYLAFFVAGQFDITRSRTDDGLPVINAVASRGGSEGDYAAVDLARSAEVIDFESGLWGRYPFDALGGVAPAADFGFALENQTRPVYTRGFWSGGPNVYVIVHELAHQWYGDSVSVRNWKDMWLNEGFATFTEWMWSERHREGTAAELFAQTYHRYPASNAFWQTKIGNPGAGNEFASAVYDRGAMTLQALRTRIGGSDFFSTMRTWARVHRYGNADVRQFIRLAERKSGKDLETFAHAWLFSTTKPEMTAANGFAAGRLSVPTEPPASLAKIERAQQVRLTSERAAQ